jgi:hypothetical protein
MHKKTKAPNAEANEASHKEVAKPTNTKQQHWSQLPRINHGQSALHLLIKRQ